MLARINKAMILDDMGESTLAEDALSMALLMKPNENTKQLIFQESHLYEIKHKEIVTFEELNKLEAAGWTERRRTCGNRGA